MDVLLVHERRAEGRIGKTKRQSKTRSLLRFLHLGTWEIRRVVNRFFASGGALFRVACFRECRLEGVRRDAPELPPVARDLQNVVLALAVSIVLGVALDTDAGLFAGRGAAGAAHPAEGA